MKKRLASLLVVVTMHMGTVIPRKRRLWLGAVGQGGPVGPKQRRGHSCGPRVIIMRMRTSTPRKRQGPSKGVGIVVGQESASMLFFNLVPRIAEMQVCCNKEKKSRIIIRNESCTVKGV